MSPMPPSKVRFSGVGDGATAPHAGKTATSPIPDPIFSRMSGKTPFMDLGRLDEKGMQPEDRRGK